MTGETLTEPQRRILIAVLDRLIPAGDKMPAAGALGVTGDVEAIAAEHKRYATALARCLAVLPSSFVGLDGDAKDAAIAAVESSEPHAFDLLLRAAYIAYYARPEVHALIGWRTGPVQPRGFEMTPFEESVLETVRRRAPFWREAPE